MWGIKIFTGLTQREHIFLAKNFSYADQNPYMTPEQLYRMHQQSVPRWQQTAYADWQGARNEHGMPVGRGSSRVPSSEREYPALYNLPPDEYNMAMYCIQALSYNGECSHEQAVQLLNNSLLSGATMPNIYDLIKRGVPASYATEMLRAMPVIQQAYEQDAREARQKQEQTLAIRITAEDKVSSHLKTVDEAWERYNMNRPQEHQIMQQQQVITVAEMEARLKEMQEDEQDAEIGRIMWRDSRLYDYALTQSEVERDFQESQARTRQEIIQAFGISAQELGELQ